MQLTVSSMTCRLPQTPRTPTGAAEHYFDDVFRTNVRAHKAPGLRRSSTSRSIGFRSDYAGTTDDDDDDEAVTSPVKRKNSIGYLDDDAIKQRQEMEEQFKSSVSTRLERVKTGLVQLETDEFETSLDGSSDRRPNGNKRRERRTRGDYFEQDPYFSK
jgi:hypothetical protein